MLSVLVKRVSDKVQVMGGTAQDGAGGTKSVGAIDGVKQTVTDVVAQTVTDVVTQTATNVVAEYVKMTGAGRARLVPVSYVDELLATLIAGGASVVEPLAGVPVEICDIKGRAAAGELLVADVRTIGAELSPACRLGAELAVAEDASARVSRHAASDAAQVVAAYLACHPRVEAVRYPGLKTDPSFACATSQLVGGFGPYVDYMWKESPGEWHRFTATDEDARTQIINFERLG